MQDARAIYLKKGIWLYFFLLIFEGALRKWVLPGLATPLLIVRDPVAFSLIFYSVYWGYWRPNTYVILAALLTGISVVLTLLVGHGNLTVTVYGARVMLLHFPLIFIIGHLFDYEDVIRVGRVMLILGIGMTILMAMQFYSPQTAWVNRGVAGDLSGSGFSGAGGFFRVPGTFSFINGLTNFYALLFPFILYFLLTARKGVSKWVLYVCVLAYIVALPMSISRSMLFQTLLSILFLMSFSMGNTKIITRVVAAVCVVFLVFLFGSSIPSLESAKEAFLLRFETANQAEGGIDGVLVDRFLGGMVRALDAEEASWWGQGIGMGSNAGASLLSAQGKFLISEGEWGRLIGERGILLGFAIVFLRVYFVVTLFVKSWLQVKRRNYLPWLLLSAGAILIVQGQWSQPTSLGFAVVFGGLILAGMNKEEMSYE